MQIEEIKEILEAERNKLFSDAEQFETLYQTLAESLATLTVPFRDIFGAELAEAVGPEEEPTVIHIAKHSLQSAAGQMQENILWLRQITANIRVIQKHLRKASSPDLADLKELAGVHADIREFLQQLYGLRRSAAARGDHTQMPHLVQSKKKDIEKLLSGQLEPFVDRLIQIERDRYSLALRTGLQEDQKNLAVFSGSQKELDLFIRSKCEDLDIPFERDIVALAFKELKEDDESLLDFFQERYKGTARK